MLASNAPLGAEGSDGNDLFAAVKPLGLKLERNPLRSKMLVVDHVERVPTAN
jgi:uncharacterized protein (TIGR03435 family)